MIRLFKRKKEKKELIATAFHEAGHCIIAALFEDKLFLKQISINKDFMRSIKAKTVGGLLIEFHEDLDPNDFASIDHLILISLAGICAKTIHVKGKKFVLKNRDNFSSYPKQMILEGATDDYEIATTMSKRISYKYKIQSSYIQWSAFKWLYDFFLLDSIWQATTIVANEVMRHPDKSLNHEELEQLFKQKGVLDLIKYSKDEHLKLRYPITRESLVKIK